MIKSFLMGALSFFSLSLLGQTKTPTEINYTLVHTGATPYNIENNNSFYKFSTSFSDKYIIETVDTLSDCKTLCTKKTLCLGIADYYDENNEEHCNLLSKLGDISNTYVNVTCYKKVSYYENIDLHSLQGKVLDTYYENQTTVHKVFIDLNMNGIFDNNEPSNTTNFEGDFIFTNLSVNNYLIREVQEDNCIQLVPGIRGINGIARGSGYVDNVVDYYFDGHHTNAYFNGGIITNRETGEFVSKTNVLWYTYNKRDDRFVSLYPEYSVVYAFVDEAIIDGPGTDIVITTFLNSTTNAHVSVSKDNIYYEYLGVLNGSMPSPHTFDLDDIDYDEHVAYLSLHFFNIQMDEHPNNSMFNTSNNDYQPLNIATIYGKKESLAQPSFGIFSSVPQKSNDRLIFIKDCHYDWGCEPYCIFGKINDSDIKSCFTGCELWERTTTCKCSNYKNYNIIFKGDNFNEENCLDGCKYAINREIFPDYTLRTNTGGVTHHKLLDNNCNYTSNKQCFLDNIMICSSSDNCSAISFNDTYYGMMFDSFEFLDDNNTIFLVKNEHLGDNELENYGYTTSQTSTPTSSATSSPTTSATSSATTSATSSATSSPTSSATSSPTSSATTSATSSPTFSATTSQTIMTIQKRENNIKEKGLGYVDIVFIVIASCLLFFVILLFFTLATKRKPDNRPSFSYANPIYSYDDENNTISEENNENNSFYNDAPPMATTYSNFTAEEQTNRYKLGLDPLPPSQTDI